MYACNNTLFNVIKIMSDHIASLTSQRNRNVILSSTLRMYICGSASYMKYYIIITCFCLQTEAVVIPLSSISKKIYTTLEKGGIKTPY